MAGNSRHAGAKGFGSVNSNAKGSEGPHGAISKGSGKGKPTGTPKPPKNRSSEVGNKAHNSQHGRWC